MARYEAGETLASIAKTYDCSPPAISYIVSRSRARRMNGAVSHATAEPQLVKAHAHDDSAHRTAANAVAATPEAVFTSHNTGPQPADTHGSGESIGVEALFRRPASASGHGNGSGASHPSESDGDRRAGGFPGLPPAVSRQAAPPPEAMPSQPVEPRPTLHLSLGNGHANQVPHSGGQASPERQDGADRSMMLDRASDGFGSSRQPQPAALPDRGDRHAPHQTAAPRPPEPPRHGYPQPATLQNPADNGAVRKDGSGAHLDKELRVRVDGDIAAFLSAFDAALSEDSQENRSALRAATDRLLRAGARTRIELERLEARVPLLPREAAARLEPAWRTR